MFDFSLITDQFGKNGKQFISKYLIVHKNTNNLEKEIKDLKKERNKFRAQKELFEDGYKDLYEDNIEAENNSRLLYTILEHLVDFQKRRYFSYHSHQDLSILFNSLSFREIPTKIH